MFLGSGSWDIPYALYKPKKKNAIKGKARGEGDHLTLSIVYMCMGLCNMISSFYYVSIGYGPTHTSSRVGDFIVKGLGSGSWEVLVLGRTLGCFVLEVHWNMFWGLVVDWRLGGLEV